VLLPGAFALRRIIRQSVEQKMNLVDEIIIVGEMAANIARESWRVRYHQELVVDAGNVGHQGSVATADTANLAVHR